MMRKVLDLDHKRPLRDELREEGKIFLIGIAWAILITAGPVVLAGLLQ